MRRISARTVAPFFTRWARADLVLGAALLLSLTLTLHLYWPSLRGGLFADDFLAMAMMEGTFASPRAPLDLFNFADGTDPDLQALRRLGSVPWWAPNDLKISFLRPLSSAVWHLDRALFGDAFGLYHAHSIAVFALLVIATAWLYRALFPGWIAALALLIFAVDDSHQFPVLWLSNRGGIYASLCGVLALLLHVRSRERGLRRYAIGSAAAALVGFSFGEWVLPMLAYILAFEVAGARASLRSRALAIAPFAAMSVLFLTLRSYLEYGARGSGAYIDPGIDPWRFAVTASHRIPVFVADMLWNVPSEWWDLVSPPWREELLRANLIEPRLWMKLPDWRFFHFSLGVLAILTLGAGYGFCARGLSAAEKHHLRWLLLGAVGALVPVVGSFASTRLTIASFLGVAPLLACVVREVARRLRAAPRIQPLRFAAYYVVLLALFHLQLVAPLQADMQARINWHKTTSQWVRAAELDPSKLASQRVFLLSGDEFTTTFFFAYIWSYFGLPLPHSYYPLVASPHAHLVERSADNELVLHAITGEYLSTGHESMFQAPTRIWREGELVGLDGMRVTAERVRRGVPGRLRFTFDRSVDDPSYVFLVALPFGLVRYKAPPIGTQRLLGRAAGPNWYELDRHRYLVRIAPVPEILQYTPAPSIVYFEPP